MSTNRSVSLMASIALTMTMLAGCSEPCAVNVVGELPSPDGRLNAVSFTANCGATSDYTSGVSLLAPGHHPSGDANAFIADSNHGNAATIPQGGPKVSMKWESPLQLSVGYAAGARIFKEEQTVSGVTITYRARDIE